MANLHVCVYPFDPSTVALERASSVYLHTVTSRPYPLDSTSSPSPYHRPGLIGARRRRPWRDAAGVDLPSRSCISSSPILASLSSLRTRRRREHETTARQAVPRSRYDWLEQPDELRLGMYAEPEPVCEMIRRASGLDGVTGSRVPPT